MNIQNEALNKYTIYIGNSIKLARKSKKIQQYHVAKKAGISQSYLSLVEAGLKIPSMETLTLIADALGMTVPVMFSATMKEEYMKKDISRRWMQFFDAFAEEIANEPIESALS